MLVLLPAEMAKADISQQVSRPNTSSKCLKCRGNANQPERFFWSSGHALALLNNSCLSKFNNPVVTHLVVWCLPVLQFSVTNC